jgi:putative ABC transport system permease protein
MTRVALKGLLGRKVRAILTSLAIVLGVAMISGTFVLTDTIKKAFTGVYDSAYSSTSVIVTGKDIVKDSASRPTVPASLLAQVRALPGVAAASGSVADTVRLIGRDGKAIGGANGEGQGFGVDPRQPRFSPIKLTAGTWASGPHQVVIDSTTASKHHYRIGDTIAAKADGPIRRFTITGIGKLGGATIGGLTLAAFDVPTAQALLDKPGRYDEIDVAAARGVSEAKLAGEVRPLLARSMQVKTADQQAKDGADQIDAGLGIIRGFLLAFAGIALFVGAFVIFNTISITIAQRARELATLRTLGASRRQVLRSVLLETLAIGLLASALGLLVGVGLAKGLDALFSALGAELPKAGTVVSGRTVAVSMLAGTLITLLAGLFPAVRATRVPPISAVREGAELPKSRLAPVRPYVAGATIVLGVAAIADGIFAGGSASSVLVPMGVGTLLLFLGVAMISSHLVRPLAALVGRPARSLGGSPGRLAAENSVRNPGRTASTAAALMIGLALVTFVATLGNGLRSSFADSLGKQIRGDYVVSASSNSDVSLFPVAAGDAAARAPGVTVASSVRSDKARVLGQTTDVAGVDPATIARVYHFEWRRGSDATLDSLGNDGAIMEAGDANTHHLAVGSRFKLQTASGATRTFTVRGTYHTADVEPLFGGVLIAQRSFDGVFPQPRNAFTLIAGGTQAGLKHALAAYPDAQLDSKQGYITKDQKDFDKFLMLLYVLLALSVIVSLFGMVNTMVLSVFERTRELGMLRAIGMTRRQARRMIRHESVITALIGAALGLPLGVFLAAIVTQGLSDQGIGFHLPVGSLIAFTLVAVIAGILAAVLPARRASRLDVLHALQYE